MSDANADSLRPLTGPTLIMGILNVTPDSFSDGGAWNQPDQALSHALEMEQTGANLIDIGGESTRPGAAAVSAAEEQARVLPVIEKYLAYHAAAAQAGTKSTSPCQLSVDTVRAETAEKALAAGATLINDISGGLFDPEMADLIAQSGARYICQHLRGTPETMDQQVDYGSDLIGTILAELEKRLEHLRRAGVQESQIILDPGLGFAKTNQQSWQILREISRFQALGYPLLIGASRKRFLALTDGAVPSTPTERDYATGAITMYCAQQKIWAVRVHNVAASRAAVETVKMLEREHEC